MEPFDVLNEFLSDEEDMDVLTTFDVEAYVSDFADILEEFDVLNRQLWRRKSPLPDAKTKTLGSKKYLELSQ